MRMIEGLRQRVRQRPVLGVLAGQAALSGSAFLTTLCLGRFGGAPELGAYALGLTLCFLASSLGDTLITTPYTFHAGQPALGRPQPWAQTALWGMGLLAFLLGAVMVGLSAPWALALHGPDALWPALPLAVAAVLARDLLRRHQLVRHQPWALMRQDLLTASVQVAGLVALISLGRATALNALWLMAASALLPALPTLGRAALWQRTWRLRQEAWKGLNELWQYGRWLVLGGLLHVSGTQAWPWLAWHSGGAQQAGLMAACQALANLLSPVLTGLSNHDRPLFMQVGAQADRSAFLSFTRQRAVWFLLPALLLWALATLGGEQLLSWLYGAAFAQARWALSWMCVATVAVALAAPLQLALLGLRVPVSNPVHHGSTLVVLALAVWWQQGRFTLLALGQWQAAVMVLGTGVLGGVFWLGVRRHAWRVGGLVSA